MSKDCTPDQIIQLSFGFWASKTLLSAVELGLFTELAKGPLKAETLGRRLGIHPRGARDFFDALFALQMLERSGDQYANTPKTEPVQIAPKRRADLMCCAVDSEQYPDTFGSLEPEVRACSH